MKRVSCQEGSVFGKTWVSYGSDTKYTMVSQMDLARIHDKHKQDLE